MSKPLEPRPPHPQDSLSYTSEKLPQAQREYDDAKHRLHFWKQLVAKGEERLATASAERARLRMIERVAMKHLGLSTDGLPLDYSDEEPEEKKKKLADEQPPPRPSEAPRLG